MDINKLMSKILIIDDNTANILLLKRMLNIAGYNNVHTLTDSRKASEFYSTYNPDLILLDFRMPFMDGLQVIDELYSKRGYNPVPIIMISAENDQTYYNDALTRGAVDFITKPFNYNEIILKIQTVLQKHIYGNP